MGKNQNNTKILQNFSQLGLYRIWYSEKNSKSFNESELDRLYSVFPFLVFDKSRSPVGIVSETQEHILTFR